MRTCIWALAALFVGVCCVGTQAETDSYCNSVSFTSDLEDPKDLLLPSFDDNGGLHDLLSVTVDVYHTGSAQPAGDNDDPYQGAIVRARVIRQFSAAGPNVFSVGGNTVNSDFITLDPDDGDLDVFDSTPPDGHDFGILGYADMLAGSYAPDMSLYEGPGDVAFSITPMLMVNDLQFEDPPGTPDSWQLQVEFPILEVEVCVTYEYEIVPEPASLALLALGGLLVLRRR